MSGAPSPGVRFVASIAVFPVIFFGAIGVALVLIERGIAPVVILAVISPGLWLAFLAGERLLPHRRDWVANRGDLRTDLCHFVVNYKSLDVYMVPLALVFIPIGGAVSRAIGSRLWPSEWPLVAQMALALVVAELGQYWAHRLAHRSDFLWRFHSTHHSAERLYWINAGRDHPLGFFLLYGASVVPLLLLGCGEQALALYVLVSIIHSMFQHCNLDVRLGPLNYVFSMAEAHRWHHSTDRAESNHNFGSNLIIWDIVFGTWLWSPHRGPERVGLPDMPGYPQTYLAQLAAPFRWHRLTHGAETTAGDDHGGAAGTMHR